jgi:hypothetical protein
VHRWAFRIYQEYFGYILFFPARERSAMLFTSSTNISVFGDAWEYLLYLPYIITLFTVPTFHPTT